MTTRLNPYLGFRDNAREAMDFYQSVFGGELTRSTFAEFQASQDPTEQEKIMHSMLETEDGLALMAADTPNAMDHMPGTNFAISLSGQASDEDRLRGCWDQLVKDGTAIMPLEQAPWGDTFGMFTDKFGVMWMVNIAGSAK